MTNMEAYWNASLCDAISAWQSFRNNVLLGHKPTWDEWLNDYECNKPPQIRNCDVYKTKGEAERAFLSKPCVRHGGAVLCDGCMESGIANKCGIDWLFAPAEGGAE